MEEEQNSEANKLCDSKEAKSDAQPDVKMDELDAEQSPKVQKRDMARPENAPEQPPAKKVKCGGLHETSEVIGAETGDASEDASSEKEKEKASCSVKTENEFCSSGNDEKSEEKVSESTDADDGSKKSKNCEGKSNKSEKEPVASNETEKHVTWERKKKVALLMSYCGAGYFGMQKNPGVNTIEDELFDALYKAGGIRADVKDDLGKMSFQRAARTDKGVSAARQVVSLKMVPNEKLLPEINKHLPPSIRVFGMKRVTKGFDSKLQCSARTYQYLLPTFAFAPTEMLSVPSFRIKTPEITKINEILKLLCGTHNFHNFTSGKSPNEASSKRYIMDFLTGETFVKKGYEFMILSVKGQSFMLHQIRKMIGLCIAICRGYCGVDVIEKAWGKNKVDIPKAPGLGLILDTVHYDRYNQKFGTDGVHEPLSWEEKERDVSEFKNNFIWDTIIESEITQRSMLKWLNTLNNHTYTENRNQLLDAEK